ncbi:hypothetical protein F4678DRAFT_438927 [Xylaria arbuscula]|nr:hypothetical protein F4678DRAFT_438927 [Xylaria arbuscula]
MAAKKSGQVREPIIRAFGNLECYEFHMLQLKFLGNTIVSCRYANPAQEHHERVVDDVEDAIARVVLEHPAMRVDVVNADTKRPAWVATHEIDFAHHVQWVDISNKDTEMFYERIEKRLDEPYAIAPGRPRWRVLILFKNGDPFFDVVFDYSHAFGDGTSGKIFHETLLRTLNTSRISPTPTPSTPEIPGKTETQTSVLKNRVLTIPRTSRISRTLPPPMEKAGKFSVTAKYAISTAWKELQPPAFSLLTGSASSTQGNLFPIRATPYKTRFRAFEVRSECVARIIAQCRAHKTTVTGLLHALLLASMASRIPPLEARDGVFRGNSALDLRRHIVDDATNMNGNTNGNTKGDGEVSAGLDPRRTVANYVSAMTHEFDADFVRKIREAAGKPKPKPKPSSTPSGKDQEDGDGNRNGDGLGDAEGHEEGKGEGEAIAPDPALVDLVWQVAARVRGELQARIDSGLRNDVVGLMKLVPDWRAQFRSDARKPRPYAFVVSNLGVLDGDPDPEPCSNTEEDNRNGDGNMDGSDNGDTRGDIDRWKITSSTFAVSAEVCGAAFQVSPITVRGGTLCMGCSWQDCVVELELAEAIVGDLERWLQFLGKS